MTTELSRKTCFICHPFPCFLSARHLVPNHETNELVNIFAIMSPVFLRSFPFCRESIIISVGGNLPRTQLTQTTSLFVETVAESDKNGAYDHKRQNLYMYCCALGTCNSNTIKISKLPEIHRLAKYSDRERGGSSDNKKIERSYDYSQMWQVRV